MILTSISTRFALISMDLIHENFFEHMLFNFIDKMSTIC